MKKWTLAVAKPGTTGDDFVLPYGTSIDKDTYGDDYDGVDVVDELSVSKLIEALRKISICSGGCDGPLGCSCKAPIARAALKEIGEL
ncbi:MAG: hypothetical protein ACHQUC_01275 [Chlamydiales bacterium]